MDPFIFEGINYKPVSASNCVVDSNPNVSGNITIPSQVTDYMTSPPTTYNVTSTIRESYSIYHSTCSLHQYSLDERF